MKLRLILVVFILLTPIILLFGQINSKNGYVLPAHGHIRVLLVFVEIDYPDGDRFASTVGEGWSPKQFPKWAKSLFEISPDADANALVSRYYKESSLGNFRVSGDILLNPDNPNMPFQYSSDGGINPGVILKDAWEKGFKTMKNMPADSFDLWQKTGAGLSKKARDINADLSFDHVMFIVRNSTYPGNLSGYASPGNLRGGGAVKTDTYSVFATRNASPLHILLHEFNHLLLGGNNKHCCGGNHIGSGFQMFLSFQGGWGMMGAANKSLMTCNAFDRYKLGWKHVGRKYLISAIDSSGKEIETAFDSENKAFDQIFVLRDFLTYGDAVQIKLPGIAEDELQQWLWIENHQTKAYNNSPFDFFQYQNNECIENALPGLYAYIQVSHADTSGKAVFGGYADYIRPLPASGMYDLQWGDTMVQNPWCVNNAILYPFERKERMKNPLSGNTVCEIIPIDLNQDGFIGEKEKREQAIEKRYGSYQYNLPYLGEAEFAFRLDYNSKINIAGNPSSANVLTLVNDDRDIFNGQAPNNRTIYLNGISIEIIKENFLRKGDVLIRVRSNDYVLDNDVRWCAPSIVLSDLSQDDNYDLIIERRKTMIIDLGETPVRMDSAFQYEGKNYFTSPSEFCIMPGAKILMKKNSRIILKNNARKVVSNAVPRRDVTPEK